MIGKCSGLVHLYLQPNNLRLLVGPAVIGVSKAVYKAYRFRHDAQAAYDRTLARHAVHVFANREEAAGGKLVSTRLFSFTAQ